jgi:hypothetical protein
VRPVLPGALRALNRVLMAVAELSATRGMVTRWAAGFAVAAALASVGGAIWFVVETVFGTIGVVRPFLAAASIGIGGLAGYGALIGTGRSRGWQTQAIGVLASLPVLVVAQALVTRLLFVRELESIGYFGATFRLPLSQWWEYVSWALFSTSPPSLFFWALAMGSALAVPRRYPYAEYEAG